MIDARIALGPDELHLWRLQIGDAMPTATDVLSADEEARADSFVHAVDAAKFRFVRASLRCLLGHYLAVAPQSIGLAATADGKPFVSSPNPAEINFNVAHCDTVALIVVGRQAI